MIIYKKIIKCFVTNYNLEVIIILAYVGMRKIYASLEIERVRHRKFFIKKI